MLLLPAALLLLGEVAASGPLVAFPEGPPLPGEEVPMLLYLPRTEVPPDILPERGALTTPLAPQGDGLWATRYRAAPDPRPDRLYLEETATLLGTVQPRTVTDGGLRLQVVGSRPAGGRGRPTVLRVEGERLPPPEALEVVVSEGSILSVTRSGEVLEVVWRPGASPFPRAVPVGVRDRRQPGSAPAWGVVRLNGTLSLPIRTEPGAQVTVFVGGRVYGPEVADARGELSLSVEVLPGETTARVLTEDALGNTQQSVLAVGGDPLPAMALLVAGSASPELPPAAVYLSAVRADGRPWRGEGPRCTLDGAPLPTPLLLHPGEWQVLASAAGTVDCALEDQAHAAATVPRGAPAPAELVLRLDPRAVSGDNPESRITAYVVDDRGGRADPGQLSLSAQHGAVRDVQLRDGYLEALYDGMAAVSRGRDTLGASWVRPAGEPVAWQLQVETRAPTGLDGVVDVWVRALDQGAQAAAGATVQVTLGGAVREVTAGLDGWASVRLAASAEARVLSVRSGALVREAVLLPGAAGSRGVPGPDLRATESITLQAGRVRGIFLTTTPRVIAAETGRARVEVRLVDAVGFPVLDADVRVEASTGRLTPIVPEPDGSYYAEYMPPMGLMNATVELSAMTADGGYRAATDLLVVPRVFDRILEVSAGGLWGRSVTTGPGVWATGRYALRPERLQEQLWAQNLWFLVELGGYQQHVLDTDLGVEIQRLTSTSGPGGMYRLQRQRVALWGGGALAWPGVYWQRTELSGEEASRGLGLSAALGAQIFAGLGVQPSRKGGGEVQVQGRLFLLNQEAATIGWQGQVGGPAVTVGYNFLF